MPTHVMLDLETLGTNKGATILAIGAVKFDPSKSGVEDSIEIFIDPVNSEKAGFEMSASTIWWWLQPERADARAQLLANKDRWVDVWTGLDHFREWFGFDSLPVWGNSTSFDNELLKAYYEKANMDTPWRFWHDRCYRTVKNLAPAIKLERVGTYHSAVDDAISQALHLQKIFDHLNLEA